MASSAGPDGAPRLEGLEDEILQVLRERSERSITLGTITERVSASRKTVHHRLKNLQEAGEVESEKVGNATSYYLPNERIVTDGGVMFAASQGTVSGHIGSVHFEDQPLSHLKFNIAVTAAAFVISLIANVVQIISGSQFAGIVAVSFGFVSLVGAVGLYALLALDWDGPFAYIGDKVAYMMKAIRRGK